MSDIDLSGAVEAGTDALARLYEAIAVEESDPSPLYRDDARAVLTAALPHIERQVREQVTREIEAGVDLADDPYVRSGMRHAASIARGDS